MAKEITNQPTRAETQKALLGMFTCFNLGGDEFERKARHDAYWAVLAGLPFNTVIAACRDAACGNLGDGCFVPTSAMLYQRANSYLPRPTHHDPLPPPQSIPPDDRHRVSNGFKALHAALRGVDLTGETEVPTTSIEVLKDIALTAKGNLSNVTLAPPIPPYENTP